MFKYSIQYFLTGDWYHTFSEHQWDTPIQKGDLIRVDLKNNLSNKTKIFPEKIEKQIFWRVQNIIHLFDTNNITILQVIPTTNPLQPK